MEVPSTAMAVAFSSRGCLASGVSTFAPGNSAAYAELLSDKLIKSHEIFLALMVLEVGPCVRKKKQSGTVQYNGLVAPLKGKSFVAYYMRINETETP